MKKNHPPQKLKEFSPVRLLGNGLSKKKAEKP